MRIALLVVLAVAACSSPAVTKARPSPTPHAKAVPPPAPPAPADPEPLRAAAAAETDPGRAAAAWARAAEAYDAVATYPGTPEDQRLPAMRSAVEAWKRSLEANPRVSEVPDDMSDEPRPIDARLVRIGASFQRLAEALGPDDATYLELTFQAGRIFRMANDADHAVPLLGMIVREHAESELGEYAANLILDVLNRAKRYDELIAWVDEMRLNARLLAGRPGLKETLDRLHRQAGQHKANRQADAGDYAGCAQTYLALHKEDPKDPADDQILYNALVCLDHAGDTAAIEPVLRELVKLHPKSEVTARARKGWGTK